MILGNLQHCIVWIDIEDRVALIRVARPALLRKEVYLQASLDSVQSQRKERKRRTDAKNRKKDEG